VGSGRRETRLRPISEPFTAEEAAQVAEFRSALRRFLRISERNARAAGLTPQRYLLLLMIKGAADHSEQSTVTELADRLQLAQSTVTELVRRAEEIGLVERERSSVDGRIAHLRLTAEGERRLTKTFTGNATERQTLLDAFDSIRGQVTVG
jgi:DNA-binding MarR family transcriptional regulator